MRAGEGGSCANDRLLRALILPQLSFLLSPFLSLGPFVIHPHTCLQVPRSAPLLSARRVLTMEWVDGDKLPNLPLADQKRMVAAGLDACFAQLLGTGVGAVRGTGCGVMRCDNEGYTDNLKDAFFFFFAASLDLHLSLFVHLLLYLNAHL